MSCEYVRWKFPFYLEFTNINWLGHGLVSWKQFSPREAGLVFFSTTTRKLTLSYNSGGGYHDSQNIKQTMSGPATPNALKLINLLEI